MSDIINLPENFLYDLVPQGLVSLDERALICAVVGGYQDRLSDERAYAQKLRLFFSPVGLPETGPNVVFVDVTSAGGVTFTRSLDIDSTTPTDPAQLLVWAASVLNLDPDSGAVVANPRYGLDLLRYVDANILDYLATNLGAILYMSAVAQASPIVVSSAGTFTASDIAHQKLIETFFPRLKFKGTARSFEALGKLMGFDDVRMVPLWGRVSLRLPNDPGAAVNDPDFAEVADYYPKQNLDPFYDPLNQRDGVYYAWSGTVSNGTAASNYYPQAVNGFQPWVEFTPDATSIVNGTLTPATGGTYLLEGGAPHFNASVALPATGTFTALGEGDSWNGIDVVVTELDGDLRRLDISDQLSAIKYRTSFYNLGITMDPDKADVLFGTVAARSNKDVAAAPYAYVSYSGTLFGTSPYRPFVGGTASFENTTGVQSADFLTPFAGTVAFYGERREATLADGQQNYSALAQAGQNVVQALEEVRAATRQPRRAVFGYLNDDTVGYAPIQAEECVLVVPAGGTASASGFFGSAPVPPYTTGVVLYTDAPYASDDTTDSRWPQRVIHEVDTTTANVTGFTVPSAGSYSLSLANASAVPGTVCVEFFGTVSLNDFPDTHEVVRTDPFYPTPGTLMPRYMDRPEDQTDDFQLYETLDEYPYRRDILGGGEVIETDFSVVPGTAFVEYNILDQTMAVKDQTEVDYDVFVAFGAFPVPQFVIRPKALPYVPGQRAIAFLAQFRDQASLTADDTDPFPMPGGRTAYFHSELDNVFQPGYRLYHAGLVNGVLVADADAFNGSHHLDGLRGWLPFNEHPEGPLVVNDAVMTLAVQAVNGVAPDSRVWEGEQGFNLRLMPGAAVTSSAVRECVDDCSLSFWVNCDGLGGFAQADDIIGFGNVKFTIDWTVLPPTLTASVLRNDNGQWQAVNTPVNLTGDWKFVYLRKQDDQAWFGVGDLLTSVSEQTVAATAGFASNTGVDILLLTAQTAPWQVRDLRVWNVNKTSAQMDLVRYHQPTPTAVPYRIGQVLSLNTSDKYGLQVMPTGWLAPTNMPAWVRMPKYAQVVRYTGDGEYEGEAYRKEVGLGGGTWPANPYQLGQQFTSLTADGTVVVSTQTGALPGSDPFWQGDATGAPGHYIVLSGSTTQGSIAVVTASGSGASPWPNAMEATNSAVESVWLPDDDGHVYQVQLEAQGAGVVFVATAGTASNQEQGDATAFLARPGYCLGVTGSGQVVQKPYSGTVTTPPLFLYLNETLLEDVAGPNTLARWTDPTTFGLDFGYPVLSDVGEIDFTNASTLLPGIYRMTVDLGNDGKVDTEFDGFRIDITVGDTTFSQTFLQGYGGSNFRGQQFFDFTLDHEIPTGWLLTFSWLNAFADPTRGIARQLIIFGYELRRLETNLYEVTLASSGSTPVLTRLSLQAGLQWGNVPGGWLAEVNSYGTVALVVHEGTVYPGNDTLISRYPLANLLTGTTERRREDILVAGEFCLPDGTQPQVIIGNP